MSKVPGPRGTAGLQKEKRQDCFIGCIPGCFSGSSDLEPGSSGLGPGSLAQNHQNQAAPQGIASLYGINRNLIGNIIIIKGRWDFWANPLKTN